MLNNPTASSTTNTTTGAPVAGPRMIQLALDKGALASLVSSQLNTQQGALQNLKITPLPNNSLVLTFDLHIDSSGLHRIMPIELDGVISVDKQQNLQLHLTHLRRDGLNANPATTTSMQTALNSMLNGSVTSPLRGQGVKLLSAYTSSTLSCGQGNEMLVLLIQAPPIQGVAAQPTPTPFCLTGAVNVQKLLPH
jgi:hypothetical protein